MNRNLRVLGVGSGIRMFGNALYFPFLALYLHSALSVSYYEIAVIIAPIGLLQLPADYFGGLLADRMGRRTLVPFGLGAESLTIAAVAFAFAERSLILAVGIVLVGATLTNLGGPAVSAYVADTAEAAERTRGFTFLRVGFNAGFAAGVAVGGILVSLVGFTGRMAIAAVLTGIGALLVGALLEPSPRDLALARRANGVVAPDSLPTVSMGESFRVLARDRSPSSSSWPSCSPGGWRASGR